MKNGNIETVLRECASAVSVCEQGLAACLSRDDRVALVDLTIHDRHLFSEPVLLWREMLPNEGKLRALGEIARRIELKYPVQFWITGSFTRVGFAAPDIDILIRRTDRKSGFGVLELERLLLTFSLASRTALGLRCDIFFRVGQNIECLEPFDIREAWGSRRRIAWITIETTQHQYHAGSAHARKQIGRFLLTHKVALCDTDFFAKNKMRVSQGLDQIMPGAIRLIYWQ